MNITLMQNQEENQKQQQVHGKHTFFNLYFLLVLLDILWNCLEDWRISSPRNSHCWSSACLWANNFMDLSVTVSRRSSTCIWSFPMVRSDFRRMFSTLCFFFLSAGKCGLFFDKYGTFCIPEGRDVTDNRLVVLLARRSVFPWVISSVSASTTSSCIVAFCESFLILGLVNNLGDGSSLTILGRRLWVFERRVSLWGVEPPP